MKNESRPKSYRHIVVGQFRKNQVALVAVVLVGVLFAIALAADVIANAARRADNDVRTVFERCNLRPHWRAAAQGQYLHVVRKARKATQFVRYLIRQLARRTEAVDQGHERLGHLAADGIGTRHHGSFATA